MTSAVSGRNLIVRAVVEASLELGEARHNLLRNNRDDCLVGAGGGDRAGLGEGGVGLGVGRSAGGASSGRGGASGGGGVGDKDTAGGPAHTGGGGGGSGGLGDEGGGGRATQDISGHLVGGGATAAGGRGTDTAGTHPAGLTMTVGTTVVIAATAALITAAATAARIMTAMTLIGTTMMSKDHLLSLLITNSKLALALALIKLAAQVKAGGGLVLFPVGLGEDSAPEKECCVDG